VGVLKEEGEISAKILLNILIAPDPIASQGPELSRPPSERKLW